MSIVENKLEKPYEQYTIRSNVWYQCDYCGVEFLRNKKSRERLNKIVSKDSCGSKSCKQSKIEEIFFKNYGDKTIFKTQAFKEKQSATNTEKYGTEEYFSSEDFLKKRKDTLKKKTPAQIKETNQKRQQTCLELYGVDNYSKTDEFLEKCEQTNLKNRGVKHPMQAEEVKQKRENTCEKIYGVKNYTQTKEYWINRIKKCLETLGVEHPSQLKENREKAKQTSLSRYGKESYSSLDECKEKVKETNMTRHGVANTLQLRKNHKYGKTQKTIQEWLNSYGFNFESDYSLMDGKQLDLYDPVCNLAVEFNGLFWHSEIALLFRKYKELWNQEINLDILNKYKNQLKEVRGYHYQKYLKCLEKGVKLITIYEDEWKNRNEQCKSILLSALGKYQRRVMARKCKIRQIEKLEFNSFCEENHLLGKGMRGIYFCGLYHNDELLGVMSIGRHHRDNKKITLDRLCFKMGVQVVGGASKLFSSCVEFAKVLKVESIITWSDNRWSNGNVYKHIGFEMKEKLRYTYDYLDIKKPYQRIKKQSKMKSITGCPKDKTEAQWAIENGLTRIWDCGKTSWIYKISQ